MIKGQMECGWWRGGWSVDGRRMDRVWMVKG